MELFDWLGFSSSGAGASRERSLGRTGMPLGSRLSVLEDLGRATAPAADFGRSIALSLLQQSVQHLRIEGQHSKVSSKISNSV